MKRKLTLALMASLFVSAASADVFETSFDGGWFDPNQSGRGALVDYIPTDGGNGTYFIALFTYDSSGAPLWLTITAAGREGERLFNGAEVRSFRGGNFGVPFVAPNPSSGTLVGTATVDLASCNSLAIDFTPNAQATVPATRFNYRRLGNPNAGASTCPFTQPFTACPTGTTAVAGKNRVCEINSGTIASNLRLTNGATYELNGRVEVGSAMLPTGALGASQATLTVEPGTIIRGRTPRSYLVVNPGSRIQAEGSPTAPIVFTGLTEVSEQATEGSWGGLIIAGRAPINPNCTAGGTTCRFEADQNIVWGGTNVADNSGVLKYVQIRSAGGIISPDNDLNALTLGAVGNGTTIEFVQTHNGTDDGFEMFGGTVDLRYIVATGNNDDSLDTDFGYVGKIQYAYIKQDIGAANTDSHGIESDNGGNQSALFNSMPRTRPTLINATIDGGGFGFDGIRIRRGSGFVLQNVVVSNFRGSCLNIVDEATYLASAPAGQPTQVTANGIAISGTVLGGCLRNFNDSATAPWLTSAFFAGQFSNVTGDVAANLISGRFPSQQSTLLRTGFVIPTTGGYFQNAGVRGAFADGDWTAGWTTGL
jgi:hypothetical protein